MAELPASWGLKTKTNDKGTLDIIGKDDAGKNYKVRTTDQPYVSDVDVSELHDADRETYTDRSKGAREFVGKIVASGNKREQDREQQLSDDLMEAAEHVVSEATESGAATRPTMIDVPLTVGLTQAYARGERYFRWKKEVFGES